MTSLDVRKVIGSSPISSTKDTPLSWKWMAGLFYALKMEKHTENTKKGTPPEAKTNCSPLGVFLYSGVNPVWAC